MIRRGASVASLTLTTAIALGVVGSVCSRAQAQPAAIGVASVSVGYERPFGDRPALAMEDHGFVEIRLGGAYGRTIAFAAAFTVALGGAIEGGFVARTELLPVGLAVRIGELGHVALMGGVGLEAATAIGAALRLPAELRVELDLADSVRLLASARSSWLFGHDVLDAGAPDLDGIDDAEAMLGLRVGDRTSSGSSGYYVAFTGAERQGARYLGVLVGVALSTGGS